MTKKEFVSMSLPYGLKALIPESDTKGCRKTVIGTVGAVYDNGSINCFDAVNACPKWYKPILYPMSDLSSVIKYKDKDLIPNVLNAESLADKRFHAACYAMNGIVSGLMQSEEWHGWAEKYIAERAYLLADELLKQGGFTE